MGRHPSTDALRARVLAEALRLFAQRGYAATSTREIAGALGLTRAALYYHFPAKDDILAALLAPAIASLQGILADAAALPAPERRTPERRAELLRAYLDLVLGNLDLMWVFIQDPSAQARPPVQAAIPLHTTLGQLLTGTEHPDTAQRTRVRSAIGALHAAVGFPDPADDPTVVPRAALLAACGALGIAAPPER